MGATIFTNQKVNAVKEHELSIPSAVQVLVSGVLDGADVRTSLVTHDGNEVIIFPLSWQASEGDTLSAPPLAGGGIETILPGKLKFSIVNAGAATNISMSYGDKAL